MQADQHEATLTNSELPKPPVFKPRTTLGQSIYFAWRGLIQTLITQRSLKIQFVVMFLIVNLACWLQVKLHEWAILVLTMGCVLSAEIMNTAIEAVVDLASPGYHELAKQAKDAAAGAVLMMAITAIVIGLIILVPYLFAIINDA